MYTGMNTGQILRLRSVRNLGQDGKSFVHYSPDGERKRDKQDVFVCVLIGVEPKVIEEGRPALDIDGAMNALGWQRTPE